MTDAQQYPWLRNYPEGVPAEINPDIYESLVDFQEKMCEEYATAPAFSNLGSNMSYRDFGAKVTALAAYLQSLPGVCRTESRTDCCERQSALHKP